MKSFLHFVAKDIIKKYGTNLSRIAVVFPNKRAALFLNEELARLVDKPIWSPTYITISDLFRNHSDKTVGERVGYTAKVLFCLPEVRVRQFVVRHPVKE